MTERFTVYDIFAVLVPGAVFDFLLVLTLRHAADLRLFDWTGGFGDATVLIITGYASGVLLQALGNALTQSPPWRWYRRVPATAAVLLPNSRHFSEEFKGETLTALQECYGSLPAPQDATYTHRLREMTFRAYKHVEAIDPQVHRHLAEQHQMRAYLVGFALLTIVALVSIPFGGRSLFFHLTLAAIYGVLTLLAGWRMENKDVSLARHVLTRFVAPSEAPHNLTPHAK